MPILKSSFSPSRWLSNPHLQTLWPVFFRKNYKLKTHLSHEILELEDGDFLEIFLTEIEDRPIVLILHGLEGSLNSHYIKPLIQSLFFRGFGVCFMHFRGCGEMPNRLARSYHSGDTGDLQYVVDHLVDRFQQGVFGVVGFSLGGNVVLKWMGEQKESVSVQTAVAVSVPFELAHAGQRLEKSFSKVYRKHLLSSCQASYQKKFQTMESPLDLKNINELNTFFRFDDRVTAPLHGFSGAVEYYEKCSSRQFLKDIAKPTLVLHAKDDPFMWPHTAPTLEELSEQVWLELSENGGHVGFVSGSLFRPEYWLETRISDWMSAQ